MENLDSPSPPESKMIKWCVVAFERLHPWFRGGLGFAVLFFTVLDCCITHTLYGMLSYFPASLYRYFTVSYGWAKTIQIRYVWTGIWKEGENQSLQEADFQKNKTLYSVIILSWSGIHGIFKGCFNIDCPKESFIVVFSSAAQKVHWSVWSSIYTVMSLIHISNKALRKR